MNDSRIQNWHMSILILKFGKKVLTSSTPYLHLYYAETCLYVIVFSNLTVIWVRSEAGPEMPWLIGVLINSLSTRVYQFYILVLIVLPILYQWINFCHELCYLISDLFKIFVHLFSVLKPFTSIVGSIATPSSVFFL